MALRYFFKNIISAFTEKSEEITVKTIRKSYILETSDKITKFDGGRFVSHDYFSIL